MRTKAKAQSVMWATLSVNIEDVRVGEDVLISVARLVRGNDTLASSNFLQTVSFGSRGLRVTYLAAQLKIYLGHSLHRKS